MKDDKTGGQPPFSYLLKVGHISANPVTVRLEADKREREALARLWGVQSVGDLHAELQVNRWKKDGIRMRGRVKARIVQACVVTLEPVESDIDEEIDQIFVPEGSKLARIMTDESGEMLLDPDGPDLPETFTGDTIDAGVAVAEFAAMAIDPYPRKAGAAFADHVEDTGEGDKKPSPFAVLKDWKKE
ncbi:DUF177 domain-containing protein [Rhizobiaceae bacterium n13]|uniref:DUF177 domain-containing protein n=1 Tax=Ferirhizobium litorale TaxID=2927786 RepID=A0AAE3QC38_9HYPH|nr:DUF177 domain-containing protein [Fererhizobium litorale]MDI7861018.1 DUF177 domain-containing protein [Fererhizobium litorale]MDI7921165.1 DUF177 domain-containing protein [Fererhizobium litorale]